MSELKGPQYRIKQSQANHGVDLQALQAKVEKMHSIPQLQAGLNGKLMRMDKPKEAPELTPEQIHEMGIKALAQCVAVAEGDWIDKTIRKIFRDDQIGISYNRRLKAMTTGSDEDKQKGIENMRTTLSEYEIEINHREPEPDYVMPDDCLLYRRLEIKRAGKVRGEMVWNWKQQE